MPILQIFDCLADKTMLLGASLTLENRRPGWFLRHSLADVMSSSCRPRETQSPAADVICPRNGENNSWEVDPCHLQVLNTESGREEIVSNMRLGCALGLDKQHDHKAPARWPDYD